MAADTTTTEDDDYQRSSSEAESYRNVYGLTSPRTKIYGYDEHGQREEVVPIREVAGLELIEDKFAYLNGILDVNNAIFDALETVLENLKEAVDPKTTDDQKEKILISLSTYIKNIHNNLTPLNENVTNFKKISIDIKDYPSYL